MYIFLLFMVGGHKFTPFHRLWTEGFYSKFELAEKWVGPRMLKAQLSRVPWPGNSWMTFTFQPALQVPQQPHKCSRSLSSSQQAQVSTTNECQQPPSIRHEQPQHSCLISDPHLNYTA